MPDSSQNMNATERRAVQIAATGATVGGTTNTNVVAFTGAPTVVQGTTFPIGTTHVAPVAQSGNWLNIVNDAAFGSSFKFNRRGTYHVTIDADGTLSDTAGAQLGITLDQAAALYTVAAGTVSPTTAGWGTSILAYQNTNGVVDAAIPAKAVATVYITDALAGGAQAAAAAGAQGVGVLRFIANNGANAVVATAYVVASIRAMIVMGNEIAG